MEQNNKDLSLQEMAENFFKEKTVVIRNGSFADIEYVTKYDLMEFIKAIQVSSSVEKESAVSDGWVSVDDGLPKDKQKVLFVVSGNERIRKGSFMKKDQWERLNMFCDGAFFNKESVSHWMPLPSIPLPHPPTQTEVNK